MRILPHRLRTSKRKGLVLGLCCFLILGLVAFGFKKSYVPGPVSAASPRGESLGGYGSHAEFEKKCKLCHTPVHCLASDRCQGCHVGIADDKAQGEGLHGHLPAAEGCQTCHGEHSGRQGSKNKLPLINFDHKMLTGFSLVLHTADYEGNALTCEVCHPEGRYAKEKIDCITCHANADPVFVEQHTMDYGSGCFTCHDGLDRMEGFEHGQTYPLDGAHETVDCELCHPDHLFTGTARECAGCHLEPEMHAGEFGLECDLCHLSDAWVPAHLTSHPFPLAHASEENLDCESCHVKTYIDYSCVDCHDHDLPLVLDTHPDADRATLEDCFDCHPTGEHGDAAPLG